MLIMDSLKKLSHDDIARLALELAEDVERLREIEARYNELSK